MGRGRSKVASRGQMQSEDQKSSQEPRKRYEDYPTDVVDTLLVKRDGKTIIEKYNGQNLDEYDHLVEINHAELLRIAYQVGQKDPFYRNFYGNVTLDDVYNYWKKHFNFKG